MKIVQIIHSFPPYNFAGSEVYTYNLSKELAKKHKVFVLHRISDAHLKEYEIARSELDNFTVFKINNTWRYCDSFEFLYRIEAIEERFKTILDEIRPDVVHIQHLVFLSLGIVKEIKKRNIPIVFTLHDYWLICPLSQLLSSNLTICHMPEEKNCIECLKPQLGINKSTRSIYNFCSRILPNFERSSSYYKEFLRETYKRYISCTLSSQKALEQIRKRNECVKEICGLVDLFIAPSKFLRQKFIDFGIPEEKILFSQYGFDKGPLGNVNKRPSPKMRFAFIGIILPSKGVHILIQAFNKLNTKKDVQLDIFGKVFPYRGFERYPIYIRKLARNNKNIKFRGEFDHKNISEIFSKIDILVVPSIWPENSPLVIQEAFLAKTPVIVSDIGGIPELVKHNVNGLLFRTNDVGDLSIKLRFIINNSNYIEKLRQNTSRFKIIEENADEIERLYKEIML